MCSHKIFSRARDRNSYPWARCLPRSAFFLRAASMRTTTSSKDGEAHVDIKSPMGDLHVSEQADIRDAGLTLYPGAKPAPKDDSDDKKSANVNLSLPGFSLKVVAAEFTLRRCSRQNHRLLQQRAAEIWQADPVPRCLERRPRRKLRHGKDEVLQASLVREGRQRRLGGVESWNRGEPAHRRGEAQQPGIAFCAGLCAHAHGQDDTI